MPRDIIDPRICLTNSLEISNKVCPTFAQQESNQAYMVFLNGEIYSYVRPTNMLDLWTTIKFRILEVFRSLAVSMPHRNAAFRRSCYIIPITYE